MTVWTLPLLVLGAAAGIVVGYLLARAYLATVARFVGQYHMAAGVLLQFMGVFGIWILAERLHLSAVLTIVSYGMTIARKTESRSDPRQRRLSFAVWEVVVYGLNVVAFLLTGLQIHPILSGLEAPWRYASLAGAVLVACILVRLGWVLTYMGITRAAQRRDSADGRAILRDVTPHSAIVVGWAGMRGIVTLGAALALPAGFPQRDLIQLTAFTVVLGTLGLQGLTLAPLIRRLHLPADTREEEHALARLESARAALDVLADDRGSKAGQVLAQQYERRLAEDGGEIEATKLMRLQKRALQAERARVEDLHDDGTISDDTYREMEEELDWAEAALGQVRP